MFLSLDTTTASDPVGVIGQVGIVGAFAILLLLVVRYLYRKLDASFTDRLAAEAARREAAEQREAEARRLLAESQQFITGQLLPALERAAVATAKAYDVAGPRRRT